MTMPRPTPLPAPRRAGSLLLLVLALAPRVAAQPATATLTVRIDAPGATDGDIGCALFSSASGFPLDPSKAVATQRHRAGASVTCRFEGLRPGTYAVAASHDANRNGKTDRNFVGIPKEAWGVSRGVRPAMRAPRFEEAAVQVAGDAAIVVEVVR